MFNNAIKLHFIHFSLHDSEKNKQKPKSDEKPKKKKLNDETAEVAVKK